MDRCQIETIARSQLLDKRENRDREPGWLFYHGLRTARLAQTIIDHAGLETEAEVLFAGCLLHDLGKGREPHQETGAHLARDLLAAHCSHAELNSICELILLHNQRNHSQTYPPAVRALQDADLLDHLGPVGVWLAIYRSGNRGQTGSELLRHRQSGAHLSSRQEMRELLNFEISAAIFDQRLAWEHSFFDSFGDHYFDGASVASPPPGEAAARFAEPLSPTAKITPSRP